METTQPQIQKQKQKNYQIPEILKFPSHYQKQIQTYRKPLSIQQFIKITPQRIQEEFHILQSTSFKNSDVFCYQSKHMNRYSDIFPFNHNRVNIESIPDYYLNASRIYSIHDQKQFAIFSQAPKKPFDTFWQAIYHQNINTIIMLCQLSDYIHHWNQADQYWPQSEQTLQLQKSNLKIVSKKLQSLDEDLKLSIFQIQGPQGKKTVNHYHWTGWTDLQAPGKHTIQIFDRLLKINIQLIQQNKKLWIHCSAGIGRTGTLGAVTDAVRWLNSKNEVSIYALIQHLRKQRIWCIQTFEQYKFLYFFMNQYIKKYKIKN